MSSWQARSSTFLLALRSNALWGIDRPRRAGSVLGTVALLLLLTGMAWSDYRYLADDHYRVLEDYKGAAATIERNERCGDLVIVNGPESMTAFERYYAGSAPVVGWPKGGWSREETLRALIAATQSYERIWLVRARTALSDPNEQLVDMYNDLGVRLVEEGFPSSGFYLSVRAIAPHVRIHPRPAPGASLGRLGDQLDLMALRTRYHVAGEGDAGACVDIGGSERRPALPGRRVAVTATVRVLEPLPHLKASLRLERDGLVWAQRDMLPFMNWSSELWSVGRDVRFTSDLMLPDDLPDGRYQLNLGMYGDATGEPLGFDGSSDGLVPVGDLWVSGREGAADREGRRAIARVGGRSRVARRPISRNTRYLLATALCWTCCGKWSIIWQMIMCSLRTGWTRPAMSGIRRPIPSMEWARHPLGGRRAATCAA